ARERIGRHSLVNIHTKHKVLSRVNYYSKPKYLTKEKKHLPRQSSLKTRLLLRSAISKPQPMNPSNNPKKTRHQSHMPQERDEMKKEKKLLHRNIERQRRQEMAILFASLRSQLPLKYIKGKRAMSDHVNGAVNFIKDTQTRIKDLSSRRDELMREIGDPTSQTGSGSGSSRSEPASVMVQSCVSGFEVVVSSSASGLEAWPLSRVLEVLHEQGLEVISSLTARVNERLMYTIQVEVNSFDCFDLAWLQQKLIEELVLSPTRH
ncbi:unnamed protein product, partial [Arabidopsis halleri]